MQVVALVVGPRIYYIFTSDHISCQQFLDKIVFLDIFFFQGKILCFKIVMSGRSGIIRGLPFSCSALFSKKNL